MQRTAETRRRAATTSCNNPWPSLSLRREGGHFSQYRVRRIARMKDKETKGDLRSYWLMGSHNKNRGRTEGQQTTLVTGSGTSKRRATICRQWSLRRCTTNSAAQPSRESSSFGRYLAGCRNECGTVTYLWSLEILLRKRAEREAQHTLPKLPFRSYDEVKANRHQSSHAPLRAASTVIASNKS
jgi:hypothetical protein